MKSRVFVSSLVLLIVFVLSLVLLPVQAQSETEGMQLTEENGVLTWKTNWDCASFILKVQFTDDYPEELIFENGEAVQFDTSKLKDGFYTFELIGVPERINDDRNEITVDEKHQPNSWVGSFRIVNGEAILASETFTTDQDSSDTKDILHADDVIVDGSFCVGNDCYTELAFGFDTMVMMENNLRIFFDDTSSIEDYPRNDWRIVINDSTDGGADYFAIQDATDNETPFRIEAGAGNHALYVDSYGDVGLGTSNPYYELHIVDGDTPTIRLDQTSSYGFTPQIWDVAGNESNFFIRDATHASKLPFRIEPNAPTDSIFIDSTGKIGLGTSSPEANLHIADGDAYIEGDLVLEGFISERSDAAAKENFSLVSGPEVLAKVIELPVTEWNYIDNPDTQHIGPMAQDFYAAFGLGNDDKHIAALDVNGVTLVSIQELNRLMVEKDAEIEALEIKMEQISADKDAKIDQLQKQIDLIEQKTNNFAENGFNKANKLYIISLIVLNGILLISFIINKRS